MSIKIIWQVVETGQLQEDKEWSLESYLEQFMMGQILLMMVNFILVDLYLGFPLAMLSIINGVILYRKVIMEYV